THPRGRSGHWYLTPFRRLSICQMVSVMALAFVVTLLASTKASADETVQPYLLQMVRDDAIHQELKLDASQIRQVLASLEEVDGPWWRGRILPTDRNHENVAQLTRQLRARLGSILSVDQRERLSQLERQAHGTRMLLLDDVAATLTLTKVQRESLQETFATTDQDGTEIRKQLQEKTLEAPEAARKLKDLQSREQADLQSTLTTKQRSQIGPLVGVPFDFSKIKRRYPKAPELSLEGAQWLQGEPQTLASLRGSVVAVHFYAFRCINCQRNFEHYNGWQDDYADKGLVVIGIQTPEVSSEFDPERVAAAAEKDGFEYPVLLDLKKSNWDAWSNTMWPTVYLIDKRGFVRQWWQGEMNWQGTPGEKKMRGVIEQLLEEDT
ncbi:MAG: redoxin domain-containing protein, partial [Planctomycetota bacterium]